MGTKADNYQETKKLNRRNTESARAKIQVTKIIQRLQGYVDGELTMDGSQVRAAEILLSKTMPALTSAELTATVENKQTATQDTLDAITHLAHQATKKAHEQTIQ